MTCSIYICRFFRYKHTTYTYICTNIYCINTSQLVCGVKLCTRLLWDRFPTHFSTLASSTHTQSNTNDHRPTSPHIYIYSKLINRNRMVRSYAQTTRKRGHALRHGMRRSSSNYMLLFSLYASVSIVYFVYVSKCAGRLVAAKTVAAIGQGQRIRRSSGDQFECT